MLRPVQKLTQPNNPTQPSPIHLETHGPKKKIHVIGLEKPKPELNGRAVGWASLNPLNPTHPEQFTGYT